MGKTYKDSRKRGVEPPAKEPFRPRCANTGKVSFHSREDAIKRAVELEKKSNLAPFFFRTYTCEFCHKTHLAARNPHAGKARCLPPSEFAAVKRLAIKDRKQ